MLGEGKDLGRVESDDVIRDGGNRFGRKVVVIDAKMAIEPIDLVGDKLTGNEALEIRG